MKTVIETKNTDAYNTNISVFEWSIAYDRKIYRQMGEYIKKNIWEHMDEKLVKDIFIDMTNAKNTHADTDTYINRCKQHLSKIEAFLDNKWITKTLSFPDNYLQRLIKQQIGIFTTTNDTELSLSKVLVMWTEAELADDKKNRTITVTPLAKTIIANILTLLIMQEQEDKKPKITPKETIYMVRKNKKTVA